jgi:hypothetical protein
MLESFEKYSADLRVKGTTTMEAINNVEHSIGISFPQDYKVFLQKHNGVVGGIGKNSFIRLWPIEDLFERNEGCNVKEFAPGLVLIGSNGGNIAYAYDIRDKRMPIVEVPYIIMSLKEVKFCANSIEGFFEYLYNQ